MAMGYADELEGGRGPHWDKGTHKQHLREAPPMRLLGLMVALAPWVGWIMNEKHGNAGKPFSAEDSFARVHGAFEEGVRLSQQNWKPSS